MTRKVSLLVNEQSIDLDYFVQAFIDHAIAGMLESLEGTGPIKSADIIVEGDKTTVVLNKALVATNPFVGKIIRNTILGMVSSLKGVNEIKKVTIGIKK